MSNAKLTFIGLGLFDEKDISLKGLEEIKNYNNIFAEFYTSKLFGTDINKIENLIGKKINVLFERTPICKDTGLWQRP